MPGMTSNLNSNGDAHGSTLRTLFWPTGLARPGFAYGFRTDSRIARVGTACVIGILPAASVTPQNAGEQLARAKERLRTILGLCGELQIIGTCSEAPASNEVGTTLDPHISLKGGVGHLRGCTTVVYHPPDSRKFRFLAERPLQMHITAYRSATATSSSIGSSSNRATVQDRLSTMARESLATDFTRQEAEYADLSATIQQINFAREIKEAVEGRAAAAIHVREWPSGTLMSQIARQLEELVVPMIALLNYRPLGGNALKDVSAIAHQLNVRLRQALAAPAQYAASYDADSCDQSVNRAHYISFYGTLWLVANDVIIGSALCTFVSENAEHLAALIVYFIKSYGIKGLQDTLLWLDNWPGGLKLNHELGKFFGDAFLFFIVFWEEFILEGFLFPRLPLVIRLVALSATLGATMSLSVASDLLALVTLHLYCFYIMATAVFAFHTRALGSLFNIFRGKKYNVLRSRTEPSEYRLDQLLVGAILFTLAAFLFPTVLAYYLVFAFSRFCIILVHAGLESILVFLNHFPLFAVMLRIKDPERLPGGIKFRLARYGQDSVLELSNNPIPFSALADQYWSLWTDFSQHYSPVYLIGKLLSGSYVNAIPRSQLTYLNGTAATAPATSRRDKDTWPDGRTRTGSGLQG